MASKFVSVFLPTFNGEKYLRECVDAILGQQLPEGYGLEVLIIDSGSSDGTVRILESFGDKINLSHIPNKEFSHGRTRDKAARMSRGEFILFLSQDSTPAHDRWLISMIEPFFICEKVGCVFGAQVPRRDAAPTIKREVSKAFKGFGTRDSIVIHRHNSIVDGVATNGANTFFSDANSAVRRSLLVGEVPFRPVNYAEDQALAADMQKSGYLKAYAPQGEVYHSNEYTAQQYFHRKFDETIGLQEAIGLKLQPSLRKLLLGWIRPTYHDWRFIARDKEYGTKQKLVGYLTAPAYNIACQAGEYFGIKNLRDEAKRKKWSLEGRARK